MKHTLERLGKAIDTASGIYCYIGMTIIFLYSFLLTFEAIARYFGFITAWIHWGAIAVIATISFFTAPYCMREFRHVRVSLFEQMMPPRTRIYSQLFGYLIFLFFCVICTYYLFWTTAYAFQTKETADIVTVRTWPLYFACALGMLLLSLQVIRGMGILIGQLGQEKDTGKSFFGKPFFVLSIYTIGIVGSLWLFTVNATAGVFTMILVFLFCGVPIAAGIGSITLVALYWWGGFEYMNALGMNLYKAMEDYTWLAFPLFVMGGFLMQHGMAAGLFRVIANWMGWIPGGIGVAVVWTAVVLGAMLGSVYACVATLFILALPELDKRGYKRELTLPMFASASVLAYLIPPSIGLVIYGALTEQSIGALFVAAVGPGIVLAIIYSVYVMYYCWRHGPFERESVSWKERFTSIPPNFLALLIPVLVVGTIIVGIFTPTEAAAVAVVYIFFVNLVKKDMEFKWKTFKEIFNSGANVVGFMGILIVGALLSKVAMMQYHVAGELVKMVTALGMDRLAVLLMMTFLLFLMGCIGEVLPVVIILIPTVFPVLYKLGFHPWWLCVYLIFMGAIGGLTPPVGGVLFATAGMAKVDPYFIFRRVTPWVIMDFLAVIAMYLWPELVTALPYFLGFTPPPGF
jgi:C4-dicarboxylate transporter DctM subunit